MYVHRAVPEALPVAIALQALKTFLLQQEFDTEFLQELGIFLVPTSSPEEEETLLHRSPVCYNLFLPVVGQTVAHLNSSLLHLTRLAAIEVAQSPFEVRIPFPGADTIRSPEQESERFAASFASTSFVTFSEEAQPQEETDTPDFLHDVSISIAYPHSPLAQPGESDQQRIARLLAEGVGEECLQEALYWLNYALEVESDEEPISTAQSLLMRVLELLGIALPQTLADSGQYESAR